MLLSMYLQRLFFFRVPLSRSLVWNLQNLAVVKDNCVIKKTHYQRDFYMFKNIVTRSFGNRIFVVVGLFHMKNINQLLRLYQEACQKFYAELPKEEEGVNKLKSVDEILARIEERDNLEEKILDYVDFNKNKVFCDNSTS